METVFRSSKISALLFLLTIFANFEITAADAVDEIEILDVDIIAYEDFIQNDAQALNTLNRALLEKGIVGIKGVPGYAEKAKSFIEYARKFTALPEEVKNGYAPDHEKGEMFLGYEAGKERFQRPDGRWVVDDLKVSYYAYVPDGDANKWPVEIDLRTPFEDLGGVMSQTGKLVMKKIGLLGSATGISIDGISAVGRMLYYRKNLQTSEDNPYWCGAHFDHGLFTALLPASYFVDGEPVAEPIEAGLFVRIASDGPFKKVVSNDPDVLLFQVGEFGQLVTNDGIKATEHRVHKAEGSVERFAMALFFNAADDAVIHSTSVLTADGRYGGVSGAACTYLQWHERTFNRFIVKDDGEGGDKK